MRIKKLLLVIGLCLCATNVFAQGALDKAETFFLKKQYWQAIEACTEAIKANPADVELLARANYLAGTAYVHLFDFLTAKTSFRVVVDKYKGSRYYEDAYLALGDVDFLQEDYPEALKTYSEFLATDPSRKRLATLYFRLAETHLKLGHRREFEEYYNKLTKEFPASFEARDARRLENKEIYFTLQVGAFTNYDNAEKVVDELKAKGYDVYSVLCMLAGKKLCRIRIGKFSSEAEAADLKKRLELDGYFVKVLPYS